MAKIGDKDINNLTDWNMKELRKLRISANNRIEKLKLSPKSELDEKHMFYGMEVGELEELILEVHRAQKHLVNS